MDTAFIYIEALATITSIVYVYLSVKQNILLWPFGLISSALYVYTFFVAKIYADMGLYVYYVAMSVYGWFVWSSTENKEPGKTKIRSIKNQKYLNLYLGLSFIILFVAISQILVHFTDSQIPYVDAFTTSLSFVATWMLAKRYIEHWIIWIFVDALSCGVYLYKELYFTVFLFVVYTIMAIVGLKSWSKEYKLGVAG